MNLGHDVEMVHKRTSVDPRLTVFFVTTARLKVVSLFGPRSPPLQVAGMVFLIPPLDLEDGRPYPEYKVGPGILGRLALLLLLRAETSGGALG